MVVEGGGGEWVEVNKYFQFFFLFHSFFNSFFFIFSFFSFCISLSFFFINFLIYLSIFRLRETYQGIRWWRL